MTIRNAFRPNKNLTGQMWGILLVVQAVVFLVAWTFGDAYSIPSPLAVLKALKTLIVHEGLLHELGVSLQVNLESIMLSTVIALSLAWLTVLPVARPMVTVLSKARFLSLAGFVPMFTFAFGGGHGLKVALLTFSMSVFFLTNMAAVVAEIPRSDWDQARTLRMGDARSVWEIVIRGRADAAFEVLRQNASIGWAMLTMVEGLSRTEGGIGGIMLNSSRYREFDAVFAVQLVVAIIGFGQDQFIAWTKGQVCPHANLALERK